MSSNTNQRRNADWLEDDSPANVPRNRRFSGGFVDMGNEADYSAGGFSAAAQNEIFTDVQGNKVRKPLNAWFLRGLKIIKILIKPL